MQGSLYDGYMKSADEQWNLSGATIETSNKFLSFGKSWCAQTVLYVLRIASAPVFGRSHIGLRRRCARANGSARNPRCAININLHLLCTQYRLMLYARLARHL